MRSTLFIHAATLPAKPSIGTVLTSLALALGLGLASMAQGQVPASAPGIELQGAASYAFSVGDIRFFALSDGSVPQDLHDLLRDTSNKQTDALLHAALLANPVEASINAFLFKLDGRVVLVDTGSGQMFPAGYGGKLLGSLAAAGVTPEQVSDILLTHAHDDHIGGLVRDGHPVFPNATIHIGKPDIDFFLDRSNAAKAHYDMKYFDEANTALKPYIDAGKVQTFSGSGAIMTGVTATVHPGHTPGSAFYEVESAGQKIVFVGDIVHVAAVQFPEPNITITYDVDRAKAAQVREKTFAAFAQDRTLIAVPHMSFPGIGHIRAVGQGYEWLPVAYGNRQIK